MSDDDKQPISNDHPIAMAIQAWWKHAGDVGDDEIRSGIRACARLVQCTVVKEGSIEVQQRDNGRPDLMLEGWHFARLQS